MKTLLKNRCALLLAFALIALAQQAFAQQSLNGIRLQDASNHILTISAPTTGFTGSYNFRFPSAVPAAGALMYSSDGIGQSTWLPAGTNGQVLSFSGGLPLWSNLSSLLTGLIEWDLSGNAVILSYNGLIGSYLGTSNNQPLVLATTNILTPQPIEFFTNNAEKMRLSSGGELGIGITPAAGKLLHVTGTAGTSNVRLASLASATGTTGRVMFATDATGDLQDLGFPASSGQVLSSTTGGVLSWTTPTSGTVTSVSVTTANGVSGVVANPTTTPAITLTLGAITPSSVVSTGAVSGTNLSGTNSGDVTLAGTGTYLSLAGQVITANPVNLSGTNVTSTLPETKGGTNQATYTLGDMLYSSAANTLSKLAGNTVATKKFLTQTGTGVVSAAPAWNAIAGADVPVMVASGASHAVGVVPDPGAVAGATKFLREDATWAVPPNSGGTVTSVSVTTANGVSGVVANPTTTPAITLTLGAITPSSVVSTGAVSGTNLSGTNSGDVTLAGTGTYLSLAGQVLTQNPIDLSTANASGVLAAARFPALTGDVTTVAGALATTIQPAAVTLAKMANLAANSIIGNNTGVAATPIALTTAQVKTMLNLAGSNNGDVTLAGTGTYLSLAGQVLTQNPIDLSTANASGILAAARFPALTGDVTTVAGALSTTISNNAVTYAKLQNTTAASVLLGRNSTGAGAIGEITLGAGLAMSALGVLSSSGSGGTVTSVSVTTANGVSGVVANPTTTPAITLTLGAITPTSVAATGAVSGTNLSGTNSGDITLAGTGTYLSLAGQVLTQNPIDLSTANASGVLAAARHPALTGDVTSVAGSLGTTIANSAVTYAKMQNTSAASVLLGRNSTGAGAIGEITLGAGLSMSVGGVLSSNGLPALTTNHIFVGSAGGVATDVAMSGDVNIVASGATTIQPAAVTLAKMANLAANSIIGNNTGVAATPIALTTAQVKTMLNLAGTNSGDVTLAGENYLSLAGQVITANPLNLSGTNVTSTLPETKGGTNQATYTLGDMLYSSAANTLSKLAGNTVATKKFLTQTGTGIVSAAPAWNAIAGADVPVMVASGASHAVGVVPDPGAVAGATKFLREDATWAVPAASSYWILGGNNAPASNIFGTTSATNVMMEANSTQTLQLTGVATANYDVGSVLLGTTATPIASVGDKLVINGGNFSLNSETNGAITREIVFRGTAGSGNLRIRGDGNDLYWQGGGGKNLQMGAYWQINLLGQLQTAALQPLSANTSFAHVYIPLSQSADAGLVIQNASGQAADPFQIQAYNVTQGSGTMLARVSSAGNLGIGATAPTSPLHVSANLTASGGNATGALFNQTLTAAANNDVLYGMNITPTFTNGAFTGLTNYSLRSVYAGTLTDGSAIRGEATGNGGANSEVIGVYGIATNTTQGSNTNSGTAVRAEGNNTTTDANSNIALHVINGEFVVGRQASSAANDNTAGNNILVANEDDNNGLNDQGPSGIVDVTDGGNPASGTPTFGTLQVFNRYAKAHSIIILTPMTGGSGVEGVNEGTTYSISARSNGNFTIEVRRYHSNGAVGTAGTWRVAFLIVNPGK